MKIPEFWKKKIRTCARHLRNSRRIRERNARVDFGFWVVLDFARKKGNEEREKKKHTKTTKLSSRQYCEGGFVHSRVSRWMRNVPGKWIYRLPMTRRFHRSFIHAVEQGINILSLAYGFSGDACEHESLSCLPSLDDSSPYTKNVICKNHGLS